MTDGTSQGLFIVVAIVIFGIFVVLAYIIFEDTLSPAMASMFNVATEQAQEKLSERYIGKNLLTHSGGESLYGNQETPWLHDVVDVDGKHALVFKTKTAQISSTHELIPGETYTFSFKAKGKNPIRMGSVYINRENKLFLIDTMISTEWETYSFSFVAKDNPIGMDELTVANDNPLGPNYTFIHWYPYSGNPESSTEHIFYLTEFKLELGDTATKWVK